jgi:hypothetical protein
MLLALRAYATSMIRDEWPALAHSQSNPQTVRLFNHIFVIADSLSDASTSSEISAELTTLSQARTALLLASGAALPAAFWYILLIGAVSGMGLSVFFFSETPRAHGLMAVASAVVICTSLWLILELDSPLSGDTAIGPAAFERALSTIGSIQSGQI